MTLIRNANQELIVRPVCKTETICVLEEQEI